MNKIKLKVKKGDKVLVISGKDKGKSGEIVTVYPKNNRVILRGLNVAKKAYCSESDFSRRDNR